MIICTHELSQVKADIKPSKLILMQNANDLQNELITGIMKCIEDDYEENN